MALSFVLTAMTVSLMPILTASAWLMLVLYLLTGLMFGGTLTLFPAFNADWFGTRHVGTNYGSIFLGWGFGGVIGQLVGNFGLGMVGDYRTGFVVTALLGLVATLIARTLRHPLSQQQPFRDRVSLRPLTQ